MWFKAESYLPQKRAMRFIDYIRLADSGHIARARIRDNNPLMTEQGLPAHVGVEYMAQALAGRKNIESRGGARSGVILNIKDVHIAQAYFDSDQEIHVSVMPVHRDGDYDVSFCVVSQKDEIISAEISVMEYSNER